MNSELNSKNISFEGADDRAYKAIKDMIAQYQLVPGQKITYIQLAERFKLSKTPIISALNRLEQEEFVISLPNRGFFIKEISLEEVSELFGIRGALEILAVEESINNQDPKMLAEIEKAMIAHRKYDLDIVTRKRLSLDAVFHLKIAEMGRNRNLVRLLRHILEHIYLRYRCEGISPKRLTQSAEEHQKIFNAIKERDTTKGKRNMKQHMRMAQIAIINGIKKGKGSFQF